MLSLVERAMLCALLRLMYGEQARFFQDEIRQDLKHKKKGMVAMASADTAYIMHCYALVVPMHICHSLCLHASCTVCTSFVGLYQVQMLCIIHKFAESCGMRRS